MPNPTNQNVEFQTRDHNNIFYLFPFVYLKFPTRSVVSKKSTNQLKGFRSHD